MEIKTLNSITISRPLIFLCGPNINYDDRRKVVSSYIEKNFKKCKYKPYCIVVDEIFGSDDEINQYELKLNLLEEIVSCVCYKTYIFLDSMSTAYELGLFNNSNTTNQITVFCDNEYDKEYTHTRYARKKTIGVYIVKSLGLSNVLKYSAKFNHETEFVSFKNPKKVPLAIKKQLKNDINFYNLNPDKIYFDNNGIDCKCANSVFNIRLTVKQLFYIISSFIRKKMTITSFITRSKDSYDGIYEDFLNYFKPIIIKSFGDFQNLITINTLNISLKEYSKEKTQEVIRHIFYFLYLLFIRKDTLKHTIVTDDILSSEVSKAFVFGEKLEPINKKN